MYTAEIDRTSTGARHSLRQASTPSAIQAATQSRPHLDKAKKCRPYSIAAGTIRSTCVAIDGSNVTKFSSSVVGIPMRQAKSAAIATARGAADQTMRLRNDATAIA